MDEQRYKIKKDISTRIKILHLLFIGVVAYFLIHTIVFIYLDKDLMRDFEKIRDKQILTSDTIIAHRGTIYSRDKDVLATSITRTAVDIDFGCDRHRSLGLKAYQEEAKELAQTLSDCLKDKSTGEYYKILTDINQQVLDYKTNIDTIERRRFLFFKKTKIDTTYSATINKNCRRILRIFRDLDANEWEVIKDVPLLRRGMTYRSKNYDHRVYPQGALAMRTIGRLEKFKIYGIEFAFRDTLASKNGRQLTQKISKRFNIRVEDKKNIEAKNGYDVVTTLDVNVQDAAHNALSEQLLAENAIWGTTIVMDVATGDILAIANLLNEGTRCVEKQNYAIGVPVNPGSTFKLVSAMALLENGVPASQLYHTGLGAPVDMENNTDAWIEDDHPIGEDTKGWIDMRTAFAQSSNVYFTKAVLERFKKNPVEYSNFCSDLLLDTVVGLNELGATSKIIKPLDKKHVSRYNALVNMAYGYGVEVTPLHTITLYNAVANNGRMVAPRLVLRTERDGKVVNENPVKVLKEQICSEQTIKTLRLFLQDVSKKGTAKKYFGENACPFSSGSKTGTAQVESRINDVQYVKKDGYYYGSMVTYFPADKPRYTIMTAIFTKAQPGKEKYGAGLAGPVQKRVATYLYNRDHNYAQEATSAKYSATDIKGGNIDKIRTVANKYGISTSHTSEHGWGTSSLTGNKVRISQLDIKKNVVPDVVGMGLNDALFLLEKSGFEVRIIGRGKVTSQSIEPMTIIEDRKKRITITLE